MPGEAKRRGRGLLSHFEETMCRFLASKTTLLRLMEAERRFNKTYQVANRIMKIRKVGLEDIQMEKTSLFLDKNEPS